MNVIGPIASFSLILRATSRPLISDSIEITVVDNPEIKVVEKIIFWRLSESKGYKFIPTTDGEYRIGILKIAAKIK